MVRSQLIKYFVVEISRGPEALREHPFIFPAFYHHDGTYEQLFGEERGARLKGAGFVAIRDGQIVCYGKSASLCARSLRALRIGVRDTPSAFTNSPSVICRPTCQPALAARSTTRRAILVVPGFSVVEALGMSIAFTRAIDTSAGGDCTKRSQKDNQPWSSVRIRTGEPK